MNEVKFPRQATGYGERWRTTLKASFCSLQEVCCSCAKAVQQDVARVPHSRMTCTEEVERAGPASTRKAAVLWNPSQDRRRITHGQPVERRVMGPPPS